MSDSQPPPANCEPQVSANIERHAHPEHGVSLYPLFPGSLVPVRGCDHSDQLAGRRREISEPPVVAVAWNGGYRRSGLIGGGLGGGLAGGIATVGRELTGGILEVGTDEPLVHLEHSGL